MTWHWRDTYPVMSDKNEIDQFSDDEAARRYQARLRSVLNTPPPQDQD